MIDLREVCSKTLLCLDGNKNKDILPHTQRDGLYKKIVNCLLRYVCLSVCLSVRPFTCNCSRTAELVFMKRLIRYCRKVKNLWFKLDKSCWQNCESF
jgi:hypothetical protein